MADQDIRDMVEACYIRQRDHQAGVADQLAAEIRDLVTEIKRLRAAGRQIVELHVKCVEQWWDEDADDLIDVEICRTCAYGRSCDHCFERDDLQFVGWPCPTLRLLAEGEGPSTH